MATNNEQSNLASPTALNEANILYKSFYGPDASLATDASTPTNERAAYGHRETIFGIAFSPDGKYLASASQDSTVRIWEVKTHRLLETLDCDRDYECLRVAWLPNDGSKSSHDVSNDDDIVTNKSTNDKEKYMLAAAGADGILRLYAASLQNDKLHWKLVASKDHYGLLNETAATEDRPQIYSLQFVPRPFQPSVNNNAETTCSDWLIMTSADDAIFFWSIKQPDMNESQREITSYSIIQFAQLGHNQFGGPRNPNNEIYVFDAVVSSNGFIAAALSDGTCRVMSIAQSAAEVKQCVLTVPEQFVGERGGHLTAISWDASGERLVTCIACGKVVLWDVKVVEGVVIPSIVALLEGGHDYRRPLFGAIYFGEKNENLILTWGVDGEVCVWDSTSKGIVTSPICRLVSNSNYPVYALDYTHSKESLGSSSCLSVAGGSEGGFVGVPLYIYDI
ncbi:hypothetical protein ACHAXN_008421 [Cyclotella atomus]